MSEQEAIASGFCGALVSAAPPVVAVSWVELLGRTLSSDTHTVIITTKEGRFVKQLLARAGVAMPEGQIYGKELKRPKYETLRDLIAQQQAESA